MIKENKTKVNVPVCDWLTHGLKQPVLYLHQKIELFWLLLRLEEFSRRYYATEIGLVNHFTFPVIGTGLD